MQPSSRASGVDATTYDALLSQPLLDVTTKPTDDVDAPSLVTPSDASSAGSRAAVLFALTGTYSTVKERTVGMICGTVVQSEASQALQSKGQFNKPFFITCFNHTLVGLLIPLMALYHNFMAPTRTATGWLSISQVVRHYSVLPMDQLVRVAVFVSVASLIADYFWYAALAGVSVTAANAISNCSPLFVYCFSICFLRERVTLRKLSGVLLSFVGVTLTVLYQQDAATHAVGVAHALSEDSRSVVAGVLVVVSSVFYAAYQVALKVQVGNELSDTATVVLLTALSGVYTVPLWFVGSFAVAHNPFASLREPFGWPTTSDGVELLLLSGTLSIVVNVTMPLLLCWTTPLETSVGAMLVVPLAGVWDVVFHGTRFSSACIVGSVLVLAGFGVLEYKNETADSSSSSDGDGDTLERDEETAVMLPPKASDQKVTEPVELDAARRR